MLQRTSTRAPLEFLLLVALMPTLFAQLTDITYDALIIGGGWSGLYAAKYIREEGFSTLTLESRDDIGGVWTYSVDPTIPTVTNSTWTTASTGMIEASDFPMKIRGTNKHEHFPGHRFIGEYLQVR